MGEKISQVLQEIQRIHQETYKISMLGDVYVT